MVENVTDTTTKFVSPSFWFGFIDFCPVMMCRHIILHS